ncbi:hypothetical protein ABFS82_10G144400 [Erythranthe guttata]
MDGDTTLSEHLHTLIGVKSEQELENLLQLLWLTRRTGLSGPQRSSVQSILDLPSSGDLDPVLASLRLLIRNCVHKNLGGDDVLKLFPLDLSLELQSTLLTLLQKHRSKWRGELNQEQSSNGVKRVLEWTRFSDQTNAVLSAPVLSLSSSENSGSLLSAPVDPVPQFNGDNIGVPISINAERNTVCFPQLNLQNNFVSPEILGVLPRVKSMTWAVENKSAVPANRVAIIALKLQDYTKSPSNETEVKFQLTKDTLEAVLRSMAYINEQLSQSVGSSSLPMQKKQKH